MNNAAATIVVVDDDDETVTVICDLFTMFGMTVVPCQTDIHALACIAEHHPTLVILDVQLDTMTGVDVLHQLRADPTTRTVPVVFFTGSDDRLRQLLPDYVAHDALLVVKPAIEQLSTVVQRLVQQTT